MNLVQISEHLNKQTNTFQRHTKILTISAKPNRNFIFYCLFFTKNITTKKNSSQKMLL